jgi:hypothetical protein
MAIRVVNGIPPFRGDSIKAGSEKAGPKLLNRVSTNSADPGINGDI